MTKYNITILENDNLQYDKVQYCSVRKWQFTIWKKNNIRKWQFTIWKNTILENVNLRYDKIQYYNIIENDDIQYNKMTK